MYQKIVVGTDGSPTAGVAVRQAIELATLMGATLHVVHAHHLVDIVAAAGTGAESGAALSVDFAAVNEGIQADSDRVVAGTLAAATTAGVQAEAHSLPGDPADALVSVAESIDADLIVVGNRGMTGARRFVLGSVPNKVSHHCPCHLLIVDTR